MKFDSISTIAEILPYYGNLDNAYRLMRKWNITTNRLWDKTWNELSKYIKRKRITFNRRNLRNVVNIFLKYTLTLSLFRLNIIKVKNEDQYELIIKLFSEFNQPKMINTWFAFSRSKKTHIDLRLSNYDKIN